MKYIQVDVEYTNGNGDAEFTSTEVPFEGTNFEEECRTGAYDMAEAGGICLEQRKGHYTMIPIQAIRRVDLILLEEDEK